MVKVSMSGLEWEQVCQSCLSKHVRVFLFVLIILYSLYLEYGSTLIPPRLQAGCLDGGAPLQLPIIPFSSACQSCGSELV